METSESKPTLYEKLLEQRDAWRTKRASGRLVVRGEDALEEMAPMGKIKWYLHPDVEDTAIKSLLVYVQEIPPGSRSGRVHGPGGVEHQHFNVGDEPCEWVAFIYEPFSEALGATLEQVEDSPDHKKRS